jgi:hypothetical protein
VFGDKENTDKYQKALLAKGYQVEVKVLHRKENVYWLEINKQQLSILPASFLEDLNKGGGVALVQIKKAGCGELGRAEEYRPPPA